MTDPINTHGSEALRQRLNYLRADLIASLIRQGHALAETKARAPQHFASWCVHVYQAPVAEAELLMRAACMRPSWITPAAVDLSDPLVADLEDASQMRMRRFLGDPAWPGES